MRVYRQNNTYTNPDLIGIQKKERVGSRAIPSRNSFMKFLTIIPDPFVPHKQSNISWSRFIKNLRLILVMDLQSLNVAGRLLANGCR